MYFHISINFQVSIFTIGKWYRNYQSHAFVLDNTDHTKTVIIPILDRILEDLPCEVTKVVFFSDNPTSQFKNKFIVDAILRFQALYKKSIEWTYFAPEHGKGVVDGVGATLKVRARRLVISNRVKITNASEFVAAVQDTAIKTSLMTNNEIEERNRSLHYEEILKAKPVKDITKSFFITFDKNTPKTYLTHKQVS